MSAGGPQPTAWYVERQAATRSPATPAAPSGIDSLHAAGHVDPGPGSTASGDGILLTGLTAVTVSIWPNVGGTLTGGSLLIWLWNPYQQAWSRCFDLDLTVGTTVTGPVGYTFSTLRMEARNGFIMNALASSLTGTSSDFLIRLDGHMSYGIRR